MNDTKTLSKKKTLTSYVKIVLRVPSTVHGTHTAAWLALAIGSVTDLRSVRIIYHAKNVQNVKAQNDGIFSIISVIGQLWLIIFGYIDVI
jgi:hypothetical protein